MIWNAYPDLKPAVMSDPNPPSQQHVTASLGCGTLILIAIIVALFSGARDQEILLEKVEDLELEVRQLREELEKRLPEPGSR